VKDLEQEFRQLLKARSDKFDPGRCFINEKHEKQTTETLRADLDEVQRRERAAASDGVSDYLDRYIPTPDGPLAYLCINVHVFLNSQGGGLDYISTKDWVTKIPVTENSTSLFKDAFERINGLFTFNVPPSDTAICKDRPLPAQIWDSRFRVVLNRVEFYRDTALHDAASITSGHWSAVTQRVPDCRKSFNIFITDPYFISNPSHPFGSDAQPPTSNPQTDQYIHSRRCANDFTLSLNWAHEIGHMLGLHHTIFDPLHPAMPPICDETNQFFLRDVFGCGQDKICPHSGPWTAKAGLQDRDGITNNLMALLIDTGWLSTLQIAHMWYSWTHETSLQKYHHSCQCIKCCAFGAKIVEHTSDGADRVLSFDQTFANVSWPWNGTYFVAPCDGTYQFAITFERDTVPQQAGDVMIVLKWRRPMWTATLGAARAGQGSPRSGVAMTNVIRMKKDDAVWTEIHSDGGEVRHIRELHFSGHMICCDCM
jgi:hypothetical protein